jgi:hypothetical protein
LAGTTCARLFLSINGIGWRPTRHAIWSAQQQWTTSTILLRTYFGRFNLVAKLEPEGDSNDVCLRILCHGVGFGADADCSGAVGIEEKAGGDEWIIEVSFGSLVAHERWSPKVRCSPNCHISLRRANVEKGLSK